MPPFIANALWFLSCLPEAWRFRGGARNVERTQWNYLRALLQRNAETEYGKRYQFGKIRSVRDFQAQVPLTTYEDYQEAIAKVGNGEKGILTTEPVTLFEPTSGSTGATKLIPYTGALQQEFQRGIAPWIADLFMRHPELLKGRAYWSVSPVSQQESRTRGGIPIGFEDDGAYLGQQSDLVRSVMAVPSAVKFITDIDSFRYVTLLFLLRATDLTLISVWNPTFLTLLLEPLATGWEQLAQDIELGTLSPPHPLAPRLHQILQATLTPQPHRAITIRNTFARFHDPANRYHALWQHLRLISCWTDSNATPYADQIAALFPKATLQGKGLLATEGFVSLPLQAASAPALSIRSHFFEFLPEGNPDHPPLLAHQLQKGQLYDVVITTGGGLYRYRMNDLVEIVDHNQQCPLLKFRGKSALVSDWFGEKLNEWHVRQVITAVLDQYGIAFSFAMLAYDEVVGGYRFYLEEAKTRSVGRGDLGTFLLPDARGELHPLVTVQSGTAPERSPAFWNEIAGAIESGLQENFHYRYCRQLGQLEAVRIFRIGGNALESYQARCVALGQRAGDVKSTFLHRASGWTDAFQGERGI